MKWIFLGFIVLVVFSSFAKASCRNDEAVQMATLSNSSLKENSGIDFSSIHRNVFWAINDAKNTPEVFAVNTQGENLGAFTIEGASNVDWEDIAVAGCFDNKTKSCLYIADTGNNDGDRKDFHVYVVEEPSDFFERSLKLKKKINFTVNGRYNFESFSINEMTSEFYLVSKSDKANDNNNTSVVFSLSPGSIELRPIASIDFKKFPEKLKKDDMIVTSGDFLSSTQTLLIGTYGKAFEISMKDIQSFHTKARIIDIPKMKKAEAIAYNDTSEGLAIYTSSEGLNQPLFKISCN